MNIGVAGRKLIEEFEQYRDKAYLDQHGIWTCGWGHTAGVTETTTCTPEEAEAWLLADIAAAEHGVNSTVHAPLTQNEFDALVCFTYNVGVGAEAHSTMVKLLNEGDFLEAAAQFPRWNLVRGEPNAGLTRRRVAEQTLFNAA